MNWKSIIPYIVVAIACGIAGWYMHQGCNPTRIETRTSVDTVSIKADTVVQTATITKIRTVPVYRDVPGETVETPCPDFIATLDTTINRIATVAHPMGAIDLPFSERIQTEFNSATRQQSVILSNPPILWIDSLTTTVNEITEGHGFWTDVLIWCGGMVLGGIGILAAIWTGAK